MPTSPGKHPRSALTALLVGLLALALTPSLSAAQQESPWVSMTLEEALARARKASPQIVQAQGAVRTAAASERSAFGAYLPGLSFSASSALSSSERFNPQTGTTVTGSSDSYNAALSASWDVFTGFRRSNERKRAQAESQSAEAQLLGQRFTVELSVGRVFFEALRAEELMLVAQARIERAREGAGAAERRLAVGSATRSDVLRSQLELNTAQESLLQLENQRLASALSLGRLVGIDGPVDPAPSGPLEPTPIHSSREEVIASLVSQAPSVQSAEAAVLAAEAITGTARAQYYPTVRLSTAYDWYNQDFGFAGGRTGWSVRLGLSYPIFNGFQREEGVVRATAQAAIAQAQLTDTRRAVRAEAERVLSQLQLSEQRISMARQAVEVAEEDLRVQQERYRLGATTILELLTSQANLVEAQNNLVSRRFDYLLSRAELESVLGRKL
jgi:outer membrane protein